MTEAHRKGMSIGKYRAFCALQASGIDSKFLDLEALSIPEIEELIVQEQKKQGAKNGPQQDGKGTQEGSGKKKQGAKN